MEGRGREGGTDGSGRDRQRARQTVRVTERDRPETKHQAPGLEARHRRDDTGNRQTAIQTDSQSTSKSTVSQPERQQSRQPARSSDACSKRPSQ